MTIFSPGDEAPTRAHETGTPAGVGCRLIAMSPAAHLFASWIIAAKATDNPRDCRLVTLAGFLPDLDGAGVVLDAFARLGGVEQPYFYERYHHYLLHGLLGGLGLALLFGVLARQRWRVMLLSLLVFHFHIL